MMRTRLGRLVLVAMVMPIPLGAQTRDADTSEQTKAGPFRMGDSPSLRLGDRLRVDLHARVQTDLRARDTSGESVEGLSWGNRRVGIDGVLFKRLEFQVERELADTGPWRDVFADLRVHRALRIRAGHFKVPFSLERTTSAFDLDFIERAAVATELAPGREAGVMVHGRGLRRLIEYEVGVFTHGDHRIEPVVASPVSRAQMTAARVAVSPTRDLRVALAVTENGLDEGFHDGDRYFGGKEMLSSSEEFYINGKRRRLGLEGEWAVSQLSLKAELVRLANSREGEAVTGDTLSDLVVSGGYVSGVWRLIGQVGKRRGVDLVVRVDRLTLSSGDQSEEPSLSPRADHIAPLHKNTWTFGANWLVNRWVKVQVNGIHEQTVDPLRVRNRIPPSAWKSLVRAQFAM